MITGVDPERATAEAGISGPAFVTTVDGREYPAGGDIVLGADGQAVVRAETLPRIVFAEGAGDAVRLRLWRASNVCDFDVTLRPTLRPPLRPATTDDGPTEPTRSSVQPEPRGRGRSPPSRSRSTVQDVFVRRYYGPSHVRLASIASNRSRVASQRSVLHDSRRKETAPPDGFRTMTRRSSASGP